MASPSPGAEAPPQAQGPAPAPAPAPGASLPAGPVLTSQHCPARPSPRPPLISLAASPSPPREPADFRSQSAGAAAAAATGLGASGTLRYLACGRGAAWVCCGAAASPSSSAGWRVATPGALRSPSCSWRCSVPDRRGLPRDFWGGGQRSEVMPLLNAGAPPV